MTNVRHDRLLPGCRELLQYVRGYKRHRARGSRS
ncbi:MAG TPA: hypothetical protein DDY23_00905 [Lachnospiraceae bacterium]|nr:hypothetical protein [Lachnospiraceae bacterium]